MGASNKCWYCTFGDGLPDGKVICHLSGSYTEQECLMFQPKPNLLHEKMKKCRKGVKTNLFSKEEIIMRPKDYFDTIEGDDT